MEKDIKFLDNIELQIIYNALDFKLGKLVEEGDELKEIDEIANLKDKINAIIEWY